MPLGPNGSVTFHVASIAGIPLSASAFVSNLTAVSPVARGYLTLYPAGSAKPVISDMNFQPGVRAIPSLVVTKLGSNGELTIYNGSSGSVDVVLDVVGWYGG